MGKKLMSLTCPKCGANLPVENSDRNKYFCMYCGATIVLDDGIEKKEEVYHININKNTTVRTVDEAKLKRATDEGELSKRKYDDEAAEKERLRQAEERKKRIALKLGIVGTILGIGACALPDIVKPSDPNHFLYEIGLAGIPAALWGIIGIIKGLGLID